jgi:hypothetical protein
MASFRAERQLGDVEGPAAERLLGAGNLAARSLLLQRANVQPGDQAGFAELLDVQASICSRQAPLPLPGS